MKKNLADAATLTLASVGALVVGSALLAGALFGSLLLVPSGEDDPDSFLSLPSPDGARKAVMITSSGGGAPSGYCNQIVSVVSFQTSNQEAKSPELQVFAASCASFDVKDGVSETSPIIEWISPSVLKIAFSTVSMRGGIGSVRLRSRDASRSVEIRFVASEQPL